MITAARLSTSRCGKNLQSQIWPDIQWKSIQLSLCAAGLSALPRMKFLVSGGEHFFHVQRGIPSGPGDSHALATSAAADAATRESLTKWKKAHFMEILQSRFHAHDFLFVEFRLDGET